MLRVKRQKAIFMLIGNKSDKQLEREVTLNFSQALYAILNFKTRS